MSDIERGFSPLSFGVLSGRNHQMPINIKRKKTISPDPFKNVLIIFNPLSISTEMQGSLMITLSIGHSLAVAASLILIDPT
jgi:hypothetical protein